MSILYSLIKLYIFKGALILKPYWLPWDPLPHLLLNFVCIFNLNGKMIIKLITIYLVH